MRSLTVTSVLFIAIISPAKSQGIIDVTTTVAEVPSPARVLVTSLDRKTAFAELTNSWGKLEVASGIYDIAVIPSVGSAIPAFFGPVEVTQGSYPVSYTHLTLPTIPLV